MQTTSWPRTKSTELYAIEPELFLALGFCLFREIPIYYINNLFKMSVF